MKKRKGLIIVLIVLAVILSGAGGYIYWRYTNEKTSIDDVEMTAALLDDISEFVNLHGEEMKKDGDYIEQQYNIDLVLDRLEEKEDEFTFFVKGNDKDGNFITGELVLDPQLRSSGNEDVVFNAVEEGTLVTFTFVIKSKAEFEMNFPTFLRSTFTKDKVILVECELESWEVNKGSLEDSEELDSGDISSSIFSWFQSLSNQNEDKAMDVALIYDSTTGDEQYGTDSPRDSIFAVWGLTQYYNSLVSEEDKEKVLDYIKEEVKTYENYSIQSSDWNCKLMDMAYLNLDDCADSSCEDLREKIKGLCEDDYSLGPVEEKASQERSLADVLSGREENPDVFYYSNGWDDIGKYATKASDFAVRNLWIAEDSEELIWAQEYYQKAVENLQNTEGTKYVNGTCTLGIASLDLYSVTKDERYKTDADAILSELDLDSECTGFKTSRWSCYQSTDIASRCAMFLSQYSEVFDDQEAASLADKITRDLVSRVFDEEGYSGYVFGFGAFYRKTPLESEDDEVHGSYSYTVKTNSQMMYLLNKLYNSQSEEK